MIYYNLFYNDKKLNMKPLLKEEVESEVANIIMNYGYSPIVEQDSGAEVHPYVNLNGNAREDLLRQTYAVVQALRTAGQKIQSCDIFHGRNSNGLEHLKNLREQREQDGLVIQGLIKKYERILEKMQD